MNKNNQKNNQEKSLTSVGINWYPGHMVKTKRQIIEDLKLIDVVIELLDARIPIASQNPDLKQIIGNTKKIIALNKCDLSNEIENKKWVNYLKKQGQTAVLTNANTGIGIQELLNEVEKIMEENLEKQASKGRIGRAIRIMILGIPNVGKSSFINRIAKRTSAGVGNKPGVTKQKQWVRVSNNIELLDTPGVLWPKFENQEIALHLSYIGTIKDDILEKTEIAFYLLKFLIENYIQNIVERYKITEETINSIKNRNISYNEQIMEIMYEIGKKRGAIVSGGKVDEEKVANIILEDFRTQKLGKITLEKVPE